MSGPAAPLPSPPRRGPRSSRRVLLPVGAALAGVIALVVALVLPGSPLAAEQESDGPAASRGAAAAPTAPSAPTPEASPTPPPLAALRFRATTLTIKTEGFFSWALLDRRTGEIWGADSMTETTWPASMIKPWLASDDLRRLAEAGKAPSSARLRELESMIRDSDNNAAQAAYVRNGGTASIKRLISRCGLTDTKASAKGWSFTTISARDTVRMAGCIADGTAAGAKWTSWLLEMMRTVRVGGWGIRQALPSGEAADISIKNGWLFYDDDRRWHINCMAVGDTWALAVLQRYPGHGKWDSDFAYGRRVCRDVAKELLNPEYEPAG
jgi:hypothetical protein